MSEKATDVSQETPRTTRTSDRNRGNLYHRFHSNPALALTTKIAVTVVGVLVIIAGLVMMVAPGPGIVAIIVGLAIVATEWDWADRWLQVAKRKAEEARDKAQNMDPAVRRRRILLTFTATVVVVGLIVTYVVVYDWPAFAVDTWDWAQSLAGWLPELPGM